MTLSVSLYRPPPRPFGFVEVPELLHRDAAGFECYRSQLWGSRSLQARSSRFFIQLRSGDLYVDPHEWHAFRDECEMVYGEARMIASEVWPHDWLDRWCPISRAARIRRLRVNGARQIRTYIGRFRVALDIAEREELGVFIG